MNILLTLTNNPRSACGLHNEFNVSQRDTSAVGCWPALFFYRYTLSNPRPFTGQVNMHRCGWLSSHYPYFLVVENRMSAFPKTHKPQATQAPPFSLMRGIALVCSGHLAPGLPVNSNITGLPF